MRLPTCSCAFSLVCLLSFTLISFSCQVRDLEGDASSLDTYAITKVEWNQLGSDNLYGRDHSFRMSPTNQPSRCYLAGETGLRLQICGSLSSWRVRKDLSSRFGSQDAIKQIQSLDSIYSTSRPEISSGFCIAIEEKPGHERPIAFTKPCDEEDPSQWLTLSGSSLARFDPVKQELKIASNLLGIDIFLSYYEKGDEEASDLSSYIAHQVAEGPIIGISSDAVDSSGSNQAEHKRISSERSAVYWGNFPIISEISIAPSPSGHAIGALIIGYRSGEQEILGACKSENGSCDQSLINPAHRYRLKSGEYLTDLGVELSEDKTRVSRLVFSATDTSTPSKSREVLSVFESSERRQPEGKLLWISGAHLDTHPAFSKIQALKDRVLAGFQVEFKGYRDYQSLPKIFFLQTGDPAEDYNDPIFLTGIGGIFVNTAAYKAHNPEEYAPKDAGYYSPVVKDHSQSIGIDFTELNLELLNNRTAFDYGTTNFRRRQLFDRFFHSQTSRFTTGFANNRLAPRGISRLVVCGDSSLEGVYIIPWGNSADNAAEGVGKYDCPAVHILELNPGEYITRVWWKSAEPTLLARPSKDYPSGKESIVSGQRIGGIMIDTSEQDKKLVFESKDIKALSGQWLLGFEKPGYAIMGFYGLANPSLLEPAEGRTASYDTSRLLGLSGIVKMHPIFMKTSELLLPPPLPELSDARLAKTEAFGSEEKTHSFDSSYWLSSEQELRRIEIWSENRPFASAKSLDISVIRGMQLSYQLTKNSQDYRKQTNIKEGVFRGDRVSIDLQKGEWISKISIYTGKGPAIADSIFATIIAGISVKTNMGQTLTAGQTSSSNQQLQKQDIVFTKDDQFLGFHGNMIGEFISALGTIYK